ncbi:Unknown protein, partial [Striga hermonthica]
HSEVLYKPSRAKSKPSRTLSSNLCVFGHYMSFHVSPCHRCQKKWSDGQRGADRSACPHTPGSADGSSLRAYGSTRTPMMRKWILPSALEAVPLSILRPGDTVPTRVFIARVASSNFGDTMDNIPLRRRRPAFGSMDEPEEGEAISSQPTFPASSTVPPSSNSPPKRDRGYHSQPPRGGRGHGRGHGRGRGRGRNHVWTRGVGRGNDVEEHTGRRENHNINAPQSNQDKQVCYRCGCSGHWSHTCRTPRHLIEAYQRTLKYKKGKAPQGESHHASLPEANLAINDDNDLLKLELEDYGDNVLFHMHYVLVMDIFISH